RGHCATHAEAFTQIVSQGRAVAVAVLVQQAATAGVFTAYAAVFTLILQSKVQAVNQTKEVLVTVGRNAVCTRLQEVVGTVGVAAEFWQNVGPGGHVVNYAVVTTVIKGACFRKLQTGKRHTGPGLVVAFVFVTLNLIFPLA